MCISRGTGRTFGWKLKKAVALQPSHCEMSFALDREELSATIRMDCPICDEMYLIREQITSSTGCIEMHTQPQYISMRIGTSHKLVLLGPVGQNLFTKWH